MLLKDDWISRERPFPLRIIYSQHEWDAESVKQTDLRHPFNIVVKIILKKRVLCRLIKNFVFAAHTGFWYINRRNTRFFYFRIGSAPAVALMMNMKKAYINSLFENQYFLKKCHKIFGTWWIISF